MINVLLISIDSPEYGYHWANQSAVPATKEIIKRIIVIDDDLHSSESLAISANQKKFKPTPISVIEEIIN